MQGCKLANSILIGNDMQSFNDKADVGAIAVDRLGAIPVIACRLRTTDKRCLGSLSPRTVRAPGVRPRGRKELRTQPSSEIDSDGRPSRQGMMSSTATSRTVSPSITSGMSAPGK